MSLARRERAALADELDAVGPDAPTLCAGWSARDLVAHLVVREARPDTMPGLVLPGAARWTEHVRAEAATRPFDELVSQFRAGPPRWTPWALPGVDARANAVELFVHHEDVRRARPSEPPRPLDERDRATLWRALTTQGRAGLRHSPVGVVLVVPGGPRRQVRRGALSAVLTGPPEELLLYVYGRRSVARVEVSGPDEAVAALRSAGLGV
jgi:uncharacterized protein (TIGR03085 family)